MISGLPNEETILSEIGREAVIWAVANEDKKAIVLVPDKDAPSPVIWTFLKEEDAEHFAYVLNEKVPQFKNTHLIAMSAPFGVVYDYPKKVQTPVALLTPEKAFEFFKEFGDLLGRYYDIDIDE